MAVCGLWGGWACGGQGEEGGIEGRRGGGEESREGEARDAVSVFITITDREIIIACKQCSDGGEGEKEEEIKEGRSAVVEKEGGLEERLTPPYSFPPRLPPSLRCSRRRPPRDEVMSHTWQKIHVIFGIQTP